jgi:hypothetical protein
MVALGLRASLAAFVAAGEMLDRAFFEPRRRT